MSAIWQVVAGSLRRGLPPNCEQGRADSVPRLPDELMAAKAAAQAAGQERVFSWLKDGTHNAANTAQHIRNRRFGDGFNAAAGGRDKDGNQRLYFSFTGLYHGRSHPPSDAPPTGLKRGPYGYPDDYVLHRVAPDDEAAS